MHNAAMLRCSKNRLTGLWTTSRITLTRFLKWLITLNFNLAETSRKTRANPLSHKKIFPADTLDAL